MPDLSTVSTPEMLKDLADSIYDIYLAMKAMHEGGADIEMRGRSIATRAGQNLHFVNVICKELLRREYRPEPT